METNPHGPAPDDRYRGAHSAPRPTHGGRILLATVAALILVAVAAITLSPHPVAAGPLADVPGTSRATTTPGTPSSTRSGSPSPSARPSRTTTPTPTPRVTPSATPATGPPATADRKGVAVWSFTGVNTALADSGSHWYYTWATTHNGITTPPGVDFVPMIWGPGSTKPPSLRQATRAGSPELLGFNEPDLAAQSNMSVDQALGLWPLLMATGLRLGSPAVASGGATPGGWLDSFMAGAAQRGYRVDFITLHWYGGDFTTADAVSQLRSYVQAVYDRYHKPIWLTEYALIDFSHGTRFPTDAQQAAFVTASTAMLDGLPYLQRYAWFALPASDTGPSSGLYRSGPVATEAGKAFEAAR